MIRNIIVEMIDDIWSGDVSSQDSADLSVHMDDDLMEDLGFDSIQIMELICRIEDKYGIEFEDYSTLIEKLSSVSDFIRYVEEVVEANER